VGLAHKGVEREFKGILYARKKQRGLSQKAWEGDEVKGEGAYRKGVKTGCICPPMKQYLSTFGYG